MQRKRNKPFFPRLCNILSDPRITRWIFLIFWGYALLVVGMNLTPGSTGKMEMKKIAYVRMDYFYHALAYVLLAGLYVLTSRSPRPVFRKYPVIAGMALLFLLASVPEGLQHFVPRRRFNWWDMMANFTGLAIGTVVMWLFYRLIKLRQRSD